MEAQALVNHAFLKRLAEEDHKINGWDDVVLQWMGDYEEYFDGDVDEEHDPEDAPILVNLYDDEDEGIEDDVAIEGVLEMSAILAWSHRFCVIRCCVYVRTSRTYSLCTKCYSWYIELYLAQGQEHTHVMRHETPPNLDDAVDIDWTCSSCRTSLVQITPRDICLVCNHF